jgi:hypothetical protein
MKVLRLIIRHIMFAFCFVFMILMLRKSFMSPMVPNDARTMMDMNTLVDNMRHDMETAGVNNVLEYADCITSTRGVPRFINFEGLRQRFNNKGISTCFIFDGTTDAWGQPMVISLMVNPHGTADIRIHSYGKNKRDENGHGDDIVVWLIATDGNDAAIVSPNKNWIDGELWGTLTSIFFVLIWLYLFKIIMEVAKKYGTHRNTQTRN